MGEEGDYILTATLSPRTRMTPALRWAVIIKSNFHVLLIVRDRVTNKTVPTDQNF